MSQISKVELQTEHKCLANKFFEIFTSKSFLIPKICPDKVKSIEVLHGDGATLGSVKVWTYVLDNSEVAKERIAAIDEYNKSITFEVFEGDIAKYYNVLKFTLQVTAKEEGCSVKWSLEYEKKNEDTPPPTKYAEFAASMSKDIDAFLQKA
ncbi:hypothetical protein U1Q18_002096 [Sarracenia purpurea var. burkii]